MVSFLLQNTLYTKLTFEFRRHGIQSRFWMISFNLYVQMLTKTWAQFLNPCFSFLFFCPTAANQKEALKGSFCVKEEPQAEEPLSSQRGPSYSFCQEGPPGATKQREEGSPMLGKSSLLSQDINVKVASELLMKLSGQQMYFGACTHMCVFSVLEFTNAVEETQRPED